jgi:hypothetical protein
MTQFDISYKMFSGTIPAFFGSLFNISAMNLGYNSFHGSLPISLCDTVLDSLSVSNLQICYPGCLSPVIYYDSRTAVPRCVGIEDEALCGFINSTDIGIIGSKGAHR